MTIGDQAVELVVQIQKLLHQCVGRHAAGGVGRLSVEAGRVASADDMYYGVCPIRRAVADGIYLSIDLGTARLVLNVVAKQSQQRYHPEVTSLSSGVAVFLHRVQLALKNAPVVLGIGPGASDLILDLGAGIKVEVRRLLTGEFLSPVENIRREDGAFDTDTGVVHADASGSRMYIPIRSMGNTG